MDGQPYVIIGLQAPTDPTATPYPIVARVRMQVNTQLVDEDFALPQLPPGVSGDTPIYTFVMANTINARIAALVGGAPTTGLVVTQ
jgi:hypothetical protein